MLASLHTTYPYKPEHKRQLVSETAKPEQFYTSLKEKREPSENLTQNKPLWGCFKWWWSSMIQAASLYSGSLSMSPSVPMSSGIDLHTPSSGKELHTSSSDVDEFWLAKIRDSLSPAEAFCKLPELRRVSIRLDWLSKMSSFSELPEEAPWLLEGRGGSASAPRGSGESGGVTGRLFLGGRFIG